MKKPEPKQHIPQVDKVLRHPAIAETCQYVRREILTRLLRIELQDLRDGKSDIYEVGEIADKVRRKALSLLEPRLKRVLNGTGVVLNTNLGRAPLPKQALENLSETGQHYCNLEFDLETGRRGERASYIEELLSLLTGCESAIVVNNNAAAVLLAVNSLAQKREVIVSRGELIEIGGSFRLPEVIESAGGKLKEVGTTNKTRIKDYQHALSNKTGILLRCHRSNFAISGFCEEAGREELVELARKSKIPLVEDLGSGAITSFYENIGSREPMVAEVIQKGVNLVSISADKLLGGPQAGIVLGDRKLIKILRKNPLYRCLRPDKLVISMLESLLADYLTPNYEDTIPVLAMTKATAKEIKTRVEAFVQNNSELENLKLTIKQTSSKAGGGSLPETDIASFALVIHAPVSASKLAKLLRNSSTPIIPLIEDEQVIIDFRTITKSDERVLLDCLRCIDQVAFLPQDIRPENGAIISRSGKHSKSIIREEI